MRHLFTKVVTISLFSSSPTSAQVRAINEFLPAYCSATQFHAGHDRAILAVSFAIGSQAVTLISESQPEMIAREFNAVVKSLFKVHQVVSWGDRLLTLDKICGFRENKEFARALDEIRDSHRYDQYNGPETIAWRLNTLVWAAQCALRTGGSFVECGVFKGDMSWVVAQAVGPQRIPKFFLFDSFEGFSPQYSDPSDFPDNPQFFDFANRTYRQEGLYERVRDRFSCFSQFKVIKGFLPGTLDHECVEKIGYLHIDLNSPRAEVAVLERLFDRVVPGGIVVFDDYGWKLFRVQKELEDSFMHARGYDILELPTGQGLVVKRSEPEVTMHSRAHALSPYAPMS